MSVYTTGICPVDSTGICPLGSTGIYPLGTCPVVYILTILSSRTYTVESTVKVPLDSKALASAV